jgi:hypothetical protein
MPRLQTIPEICAALTAANVPFHLLGEHASGQAIVIAAGARVLALAGPRNERNVMWLNPGLGDCRSLSDVAKLGAGGIGGLRVWQAPEAAYMWDGIPKTADFSNYRVQSTMDPGSYFLREAGAQRCVIEGTLALRDYRSAANLSLFVRRIIELQPLPEVLRSGSMSGVTLRLQHQFRLISASNPGATVDLWHLLQLPAGTTIGAEIRDGARAVSYFNPEQIGAIEGDGGFLRWQSNGQRMSKIGLRRDDVLSGPYSVREHDGTFHGFFWQIPRVRTGVYVDAPPQQSASDQLVQFWDGFDFCEMEYHTPGLSKDQPEAVDASELIFVEQARGEATPLDFIRSVSSKL